MRRYFHFATNTGADLPVNADKGFGISRIETVTSIGKITLINIPGGFIVHLSTPGIYRQLDNLVGAEQAEKRRARITCFIHHKFHDRSFVSLQFLQCHHKNRYKTRRGRELSNL